MDCGQPRADPSRKEVITQRHGFSGSNLLGSPKTPRQGKGYIQGPVSFPTLVKSFMSYVKLEISRKEKGWEGEMFVTSGEG